MHFALCTMHYALPTMHYALCPLCTLVRRGERQMWSGTRPGCLLITGEQPALFTRSKSKRSSTTSTTNTSSTTTTTCPNGAAPAHLVTPHHTTSSAPRREPRTVHRENTQSAHRTQNSASQREHLRDRKRLTPWDPTPPPTPRRPSSSSATSMLSLPQLSSSCALGGEGPVPYFHTNKHRHFIFIKYKKNKHLSPIFTC